MVVLSSNSATMYECRVLYIGSAPPVDTLKGTDALQEPLRQRYPGNLEQVEGIDSTVRVMPTALEITYNTSGQKVLFPLDRLTICAGVRAVTLTDGTTGEQSRQFVPVNTVEQESRHPAIFAAIIRRNKGRQIAECHAFICNSTRDALHLVNATATANMALKEQRSSHTHHEAQVHHDSYDGDVQVVRASVINGHNGTMNGTAVQETRSFTTNQNTYQNKEIYISHGNNKMESQHYKAETPRVDAVEPETIYITFDKTNLTATGQDTLEVKPRSTYTERRYVQEAPPSPRPVRYMTQAPVPVPMPVPVPRPMMYMRPPPPMQMMIRPPPPMQMQMMARPPPQRMYTRRVMSPPPPMRFVAPPPVFMKSRARSASPIGHRYATSDIRYTQKSQYQPKWSGKPASDSGFRSRRDNYERYGAKPGMFMNERAFSRRVNGDQGMTGPPPMTPGYIYPSPYNYSDLGMYARPTTKSNPRYSSSSSSDGDDDRRPRR